MPMVTMIIMDTTEADPDIEATVVEDAVMIEAEDLVVAEDQPSI